MAREQGIKAGCLKLITIWPFPTQEIRSISKRARVIVVPELNLGQMLGEVERSVDKGCDVLALDRVDGGLITPEEILGRLEEGV
jgi:2-oxoglutarate ferredoxin oxidoreductase subunit alpha